MPVDAAVRLLQRGGVEAITHQSVAAEAAVGRATVYRHWPRLTDLLLDALGGMATAVDFGEGDLRTRLLHELGQRLPEINSSATGALVGVVSIPRIGGVVMRTTDVIVVGAGPTGPFIAAELALHGVRVTVLARLTEPDLTVKAGSINVASAEILDRRGLLPAVGQRQADLHKHAERSPLRSAR